MSDLNSILVVKLGGGEGLDIRASCEDLASTAQHTPLVVVHGVSAIMNQLCQDRGIEIKTLQSPSGHESRYTSPEVRDLYVEAAKIANTEIVSNLQELGVNAIGMTNPVVIEGSRKSAIRAIENGRVRVVRDDYSGSIKSVNTQALTDTVTSGAVPVIPPFALSEDGLLNVDGDRASAAVASAINADTLLILSNVRGLYRRFPDENTFVSTVTRDQLDTALGWAQGRMKRKIVGAQEALEGGVQRVIISDGRIANPVQHALAGHGTTFANSVRVSTGTNHG